MKSNHSLNPGDVFGSWSVVREAQASGKHRKYLCTCKCGKQRIVFAQSLVNRTSSSCGCGVKRRQKHGDTKTKEHVAWTSMKMRCYVKGSQAYAKYGGKGITVCDRWLGPDGYKNFLADMGRAPSSKWSLDRVDNTGNYTPENCRWTDKRTQTINQLRCNKRQILRATEYRSEIKRRVQRNSEATLVVGITGLAGSGKSTAAQVLKIEHGFERIPMAAILKGMLREFGLTHDEVDGCKKESPCDLLLGKTPRQVMQWMGTELFRNKVGEDVWVNAWKNRVTGLARVVCEDIRFPNEAKAVRDMGGVIVRLRRSGEGAITGATHASENPDAIVPDFDFDNDGTLMDLCVKMEQVVRFVGRNKFQSTINTNASTMEKITA